MKKARLIALCVASTFAMGLPGSDVSGQTNPACAAYVSAVTPSNPGAVPVVPETLLTNWRLAVSCTVPIISGMRDTMRADSVAAQTRAKFLSATGALRTIATTISAAQEANKKLPEAQQKSDIDTIEIYQGQFKTVQTFDTFVVLATAARSDNFDMRLSAILVLGNVMDEHYACIPLVQLMDPNLQSASYFINARANLLGMLSRVAPFVYKEDFANLRRIRVMIGQTVSLDDSNVAQTRLILQNIDQRMAGQLKDGNTPTNVAALLDLTKPLIFIDSDASVPLGHDFKDRCAKYVTDYPANDQMKANIKY
jgi:hypothetical protein